MAVNEEASPICRGKNLSWETVMLFYNYMPKEPMPKDKFNAFVEKNINSWTQTHSQIARQLAFYHEENGICYPRFTKSSTLADLFAYMVHWAHNYFVPNPYAPSLRGQKPTSIYSHLIKCINEGNSDFDSALDSLFGIPMSSHDKIRIYLQNYTNIAFDNGSISINSHLFDKPKILTPDESTAIEPNKYFHYFDINFSQSSVSNSVIPDNARSFLTVLRTKPFLLLAGISGTGKSQKVRELAFMTCPKNDDEHNLRDPKSTTPGNYQLVEVKPNWHDSTELLGYYSALSGKYELTDFIRFTYKALQNKDVPFFLCLDEMNLAPVEQYFAEFLSVLETRKKVGDHIETQPLLTKERFSNCEIYKKILKERQGYVVDAEDEYEEVSLYSEEDAQIVLFLKKNGLHLPDNLFVIGTVNMDDTTHQFSRKVIDRAFTIEMNGGKMANMFTPESKTLLEYREEPVSLAAFKSRFVRAYEVLDDPQFAKYADTIKERIPALLGDSDGTAKDNNPESINGILNDTPFRVSYRVQNELVLYLSVLIENAGFPEDIESCIREAVLAILLEKVLPRVQGEKKQLETKDGTSNILKDLKGFVERFKPEGGGEEGNASDSLYMKVIKKLEEMDGKLSGYYTNFF